MAQGLGLRAAARGPQLWVTAGGGVRSPPLVWIGRVEDDRPSSGAGALCVTPCTIRDAVVCRVKVWAGGIVEMGCGLLSLVWAGGSCVHMVWPRLPG